MGFCCVAGQIGDRSSEASRGCCTLSSPPAPFGLVLDQEQQLAAEALGEACAASWLGKQNTTKIAVLTGQMKVRGSALRLVATPRMVAALAGRAPRRPAARRGAAIPDRDDGD
jgi:hypothetical protein